MYGVKCLCVRWCADEWQHVGGAGSGGRGRGPGGVQRRAERGGGRRAGAAPPLAAHAGRRLRAHRLPQFVSMLAITILIIYN